ncbi:hypothetical protein [Maribacter hydrothermalis]|uniref:Uncharacterized protein n=1 Tax=Maribacter hydrothermalis TaxID=1836467 RepID=A0A1B7Z8H9_9FLAO|nr:hypothetical protein [Maribacter hydrothermalis]APQ18956.1 hypothetical protein BTR34_17230 [Maribacter hydrothermalis]OBR39031.1 hypothetical protein A9200_05045 [Maribacter hydrothermalis]
MKKIHLKEGASIITYNGLELDVLLQVYDKNAAPHLIGEVYCRIQKNGDDIADFSSDNDASTREYLTKIYKNYFLTFKIDNDDKYLILEQAHLGKAFALSSKKTCIIGEKDNPIELEITDYIHESGNDSPLDTGENSSWDDVQYTLRAKVKEVEKNISFYSSEIREGYTVKIEGYSISILSDHYKNSYALLELMVSK